MMNNDPLAGPAGDSRIHISSQNSSKPSETSPNTPNIAQASDPHSTHIQMLRKDVANLETVGFLKKSQPILTILGIGTLSLVTLGLPIFCATMFFAGRYARYSIESDGFLDTPFKDTLRDMVEIGSKVLGTSEAIKLARAAEGIPKVEFSKDERKELRKIYKNYKNTPELELIVNKFAISHNKNLSEEKKKELFDNYGNNLEALMTAYGKALEKQDQVSSILKKIEGILKLSDSEVDKKYDDLMEKIKEAEKRPYNFKAISEFKGKLTHEEKRAAFEGIKNNLTLLDERTVLKFFSLIYNI